jgi:CHAD domain-containing protein
MAYRLKPTEPFAAGFARVGLQQIDRVASEMASQHAAAEVVHQSRKSLKRIRALLRLARPLLGDATFQRENGRYRDMGQLLAAARDRHVAVVTIAGLEAEAGGRAKAAFVALRSWAEALAEQPVGACRRPAGGDVAAGSVPGTFAQVLSRLNEGRAGFADLVQQHKDYDGALEGLARGYGQARRRFLELGDLDDVGLDSDAVHDWRKSVQYHWRHMALFSAAWPVEFEARIGVARRIAAALGSDHDIVVVLAAALGDDGAHLTMRQREAIEDCARDRQGVLRAAANEQARQLFAEDKDAFGRRMAAYWAAAIESAGEAAAGASPKTNAPKTAGRTKPTARRNLHRAE